MRPSRALTRAESSGVTLRTRPRQGGARRPCGAGQGAALRVAGGPSCWRSSARRPSSASRRGRLPHVPRSHSVRRCPSAVLSDVAGQSWAGRDESASLLSRVQPRPPAAVAMLPHCRGVAHACWGACRAPPACCCPSPAKPAAAAPCSGLELSFPRTKVSAGRLDRLFDTLLQPCDQSLGPGTRASQGLRPFCSAREQGGMSTGRWFPGRRPPLLAAWRARGGSSRCLAVACEGSGPTPLLW